MVVCSQASATRHLTVSPGAPWLDSGALADQNRRVRPSISLIALAIVPVALGGCRACCIDDFGISGHARIEGTVTRANSQPFANRSVFFTCGPDAPGAFGWSLPTDTTGAYHIDVDAPGPISIPASGVLHCRVQAPADAPPIAMAERAVPFSTQGTSRPVTVIDLIEPQP